METIAASAAAVELRYFSFSVIIVIKLKFFKILISTKFMKKIK